MCEISRNLLRLDMSEEDYQALNSKFRIQATKISTMINFKVIEI